jgi:hypothetical protein
LPQTYAIRLNLRASDGLESIVKLLEVATFTVDGSLREWGFSGELYHRHVGRSTPVVVPYEWTLPDGSVRSVGIRSRAEVS